MNRILHVSKYYFPFNGGTEKIAANCVRALSEDCEQKVICFNHEPGTRTDTVDGVDVVRVGCVAQVASQSLSFGYGRQLRQLMRDFKPDIVIFHYPNPFVAHFLLRCLPSRAKLVVYWHLDIVRQKLLRKLFKPQNYRLVRRSDVMIATSAAYAKGSYWLNLAGEKCRVSPNCIDVERLSVSERSKQIASRVRTENVGRTICFAVGRHTQYKGYVHLIRAAGYLDDGFRIYLAGEGEDTPGLKRMAEGDGKICFLGRVDDDTLKGYLMAMDVFCFPSVTKNEAFGVALAEAMYFGKPAVTFTIPDSGVNYVCLDGEDGIEAPNGDARAYAEAIRRLARDDGLRRRMGENARRRVEQYFLYDQFRHEIRDLVAGLLKA